MRPHYLVKLKIRVFLLKFQCWKSETRGILLIDFDSTYLKRCNFLNLTSCYGKFNQENMYQTLSESVSFCKSCDKNILVCFRFTVLTAVYLQNADSKFDKVVWRHYSGVTENIYISVQQIYPGQYVPNFITIGQVL